MQYNRPLTLGATILFTFMVIFQSGAIAQKLQLKFRSDNGRILLPMTFQKTDTLWILLDPAMGWEGFYMYSDEITRFVQPASQGNGRTPARAQVFEAPVIRLGSAEFEKQLIVMSNINKTGSIRAAGTTGWTIFKHPVVGIDYDNELISIYDSLPSLDDGWDGISITLNQNKLPYFKINAKEEPGQPMTELLAYPDITSTASLELLQKKNAPFRAADTLIQKYQDVGYDSDFRGPQGELSEVMIGHHTFSNVSVAYSNPGMKKHEEDFDAIIGAGLMQYFNVYFDFLNGMIYLKTNELYSRTYPK